MEPTDMTEQKVDETAPKSDAAAVGKAATRGKEKTTDVAAAVQNAPATTPPTGAAAPMEDPEPTTGTPYALTCTNNSTVPGNQYFNVYSSPTVSPTLPMTVVPLVSPATCSPNVAASAGKKSSASAPASVVATWSGGAGALALFALSPGQKSIPTVTTPVTLGCTATVDYVDDAFTVTPVAGEGSTVAVVLTANVPSSS
ncbi:hypothetical protein JZU57_01510, partial [bacterium]|nr:hypothetical protein [bacterium]